MKIGVIVESFRRPFREGVEVAASIGAAGIQAYATFGSYLERITQALPAKRCSLANAGCTFYLWQLF